MPPLAPSAPGESAAAVAPPSARTLTALLRRYGAGELISCDPLSEGLLNRGYRLATTRGRFFLKHHLDGDPAATVPLARRHRATVELAALGLPVAPPVADRDGRTVAVHGGRRYALHPWVDGRHRAGGELGRAECRRLGALLGRVHGGLEQVIRQSRGAGDSGAPGAREASGAPGALGASGALGAPGASGALGTLGASGVPGASGASGVPGVPGALSGTLGASGASGESGTLGAGDGLAVPPAARPAETLALIDQLLARVRSRPGRSPFDELAEHRLLERRALLRAHAHRRPLRTEVPATGWVHGDFHPLNLLYRARGPVEPVAIVDWDRIGVHPRAEEAVRAAAIFFLRPDGTLELPKVRAYARAYRASAGASGAELAAAVHRVWWERLNDFWILRWHYERLDHRADPQFAAVAALVVWWTRHATAVRDAFCD